MDSNGGMMVIEKSLNTQKAYLERGSALWKRASMANGVCEEYLLPTIYLKWLEELLPKLKPASRRQYICASKEFLLLNQLTNKSVGDDGNDLGVAVAKVKAIQSSYYNSEIKLKSNKKLTSSQKSKHVGNEDIKLLINNNKNSKHKWVKQSLIWLSANLIVGLRPVEWQTSRIIVVDRVPYLEVNNAKNTNGRAHGLKRHIGLSNLEPNEMELIKFQLKIIRCNMKNGISWDNYYGGVRKALHKITRETLSKRKKYLTLYSTRHQFAANAKSSGMTRVEIAALMGHAVDTTAGFHYGKKKHGTGMCRVNSIESEVKRIKIKSKTRVADGPKYL